MIWKADVIEAVGPLDASITIFTEVPAREASAVLITSCPVWTENEEIAGLEAGIHPLGSDAIP